MDVFPEEEILGRAYDARLMRRLLGYLRPHRRILLVAVLLTISTSLVQLAGPALTVIAVDLFIHPRPTVSPVAALAERLWQALGWSLSPLEGLHLVGGLFLAALFVQFALTYGQTMLVQTLGQRLMFDLRQQIFDHLQRVDVRFYDRNPVGRLMTRLTTDVDALNELFTAGVVAFVQDIFLLLGIVGLMFYLNWRLALAAFLVLPLLVLVTMWFRTNARRAYREVRTRIARINAFLQEHITGMATVQLFNEERRSFERFDRLNADHRRAHLETIFYYAVFFPAVELVGAIGIALIIWYGGHQVLAGSVTLGALIGFVQLSQRFFQPISDLSEKYNILQSAMAAAERIFALLDTPVGIVSRGGYRPRHVRGHLAFRHVWFAYEGEEWVLRDVSFEVRPGETVALVGPTGAGKTTIAHLLLRFYDVQRGAILLDGVDIREWDLQALRRAFALVPQDVFLFSGDIVTNIRLGETTFSEERVREAARRVHAQELIERLPRGYDTEVGERGARLSTGQKQLIAFARALCFDSPILILDEATASVDPRTEGLIHEALETLLVGRTSLIIAHRLSTIQRADQIIVLHKGRVREIGTHAELLRRDGLYARLYRLQYRQMVGRAVEGG
ncbi:MAG: ABC transporter ATP-binding protein/permease [Blastocatellia bacterium]|nr:ABC transporter ATP-binding protein/permease [Blastocatellia bacterium]MCS7156214.1 ABC transporter ATP-binding protein/permease [Blastocatellia bacterium]MCX7751436.1 ABC transporter ATP-binding protein/permease [Blastocatellia bacterium]MDW8169149.1 ABC transporter ATP-binding protein [Acidobacteriota bacterium]MDW8256010.1 ABC transporter ATP-binding protein [Acidobacteriota bacterium]